MSLDAILSRIAGGESASSSELLPYLCLERRERRADVNALLAAAYLQSGSEDHLRRAKVFIRRAWLLSRSSPDLLPLYTEIHSALDDIPAIREAYKRVGMAMASRGDVSEAIRYFDLWQYADMQFRSLDKFEYDFDILDCVDRLARPHRLSPPPRGDLLKGGKIRVAYLVKGVTELGSVLVKVNLLFARYHDRSRVEPMFFVPEAKRTVLESAAGREHLRLFESHGCEVVMAPDVDKTSERLLAVARTISDARPDLLVASAALAEFQHYFITALRPAPFVVGLVQGPPQQFAPPALDYGIVWSKHPLIDCPVNCSWIPLRGDLPVRGEITPYDRRELGIPEQAFVIASAGRYVKFQEPAFWRAVVDLLRRFPQMYYLVMGAEESQIPFLPPMLSEEVTARVRFLGWRGESYLRGLCLAEVLIDTFPSGGGGVLLDALALGIPSVSFENDYMRLYDQTDWSLADEFIKTPELVAPRGDFEQMKRVVSRLITDREHRRDMARRAQEYTLETRGNSPLSVRECEDIYFRFLEQRLSGNAAPDPLGAEVEAMARASGRHRNTPHWVARTAHQLKRALRFGVRVLDRVA